ncbi:MAG: hypothetical protein ACMXX6_00015 [Candidatus Woesearchaeota archaeon]
MVTLLETGLFELVALFFGFLFLFALLYGLMVKISFFGERNGLYAILSLALSILILVSGPVTTLILFMTPWIFVMIFVAFFILFTLMIFGLKIEDINPADAQIYTWVIIIIAVILIFGLGNVFGQDTLEATVGESQQGMSSSDVQEVQTTPSSSSDRPVDTDDFGTNVLNTIVNPNVLGLIALMLIGLFAVLLLARGRTP